MSCTAYCHALNAHTKNPIDKFVLVMLGDVADQRNSCAGNIERLMHVCQLTEEQVVESLASLIEVGHLKLADLDGQRRYVLNFPLPYPQ